MGLMKQMLLELDEFTNDQQQSDYLMNQYLNGYQVPVITALIKGDKRENN